MRNPRRPESSWLARAGVLVGATLLLSPLLFAKGPRNTDPGSSRRCEAFIEKSTAIIKAGNAELARASIERAEKICASPRSELTKQHLSTLHIELGLQLYADQAESALQHFRAAMVLDPESVRASLDNGGALIKLRRYAEAVPVLEDAIARGTSDRDTLFKLEYNAGFAFTNLCLTDRRCDVVRGENHFLKAAELDPDFADTYFQLAALTNDRRRDSRRAMQLFKQACEHGHVEGCRQYEHFKANLGEGPGR